MNEPGRTRPGPAPEVRYGAPGDGLVSMAERSFAAGPTHWAALGTVATAAAVADQLTKALVVRELALGEKVDIAGPLAIHHVQNTGIAFGLFAGAAAIVAVLTSLAIASMALLFARGGARHPVLPVGLGFVVGGAVSNLVDRVRVSHVTDYLDVGFWPAFNLADTFIVVGVAVLLAAAVIAEREPRRGRIGPASSSHDEPHSDRVAMGGARLGRTRYAARDDADGTGATEDDASRRSARAERSSDHLEASSKAPAPRL